VKQWIIIALAVWAALFAPIASADTLKTDPAKLNAVAWVVFCEDNTDLTASHLVLSTVYNRANSHDVRELYRAVSAKGQYHCHRIKPTAKQLASQRFKDIVQMVRTFIVEEHFPSTRAKYFYNHKLVKRAALGKMRLTVLRVYGSHTYLV
jgi:hypothetical protein